MFHIRRVLPLAVILLAVVGCGPQETPEQRVQRLRAAHEIRPTSMATITNAAGEPTLLVDILVVNRSSTPLEKLTVLVRCTAEDGTERLAQRVPLDLTGLQPGLSIQKSALIPGFETAESDQVTVEVELGLTDEEIRQLPEFVPAE